MEGLTTIRAYKAQEILKTEFDKHQDLYTSAYYTSLCIKRAFAFYMEFCSAIFTAAVIGRFLFFEKGKNITLLLLWKYLISAHAGCYHYFQDIYQKEIVCNTKTAKICLLYKMYLVWSPAFLYIFLCSLEMRLTGYISTLSACHICCISLVSRVFLFTFSRYCIVIMETFTRKTPLTSHPPSQCQADCSPSLISDKCHSLGPVGVYIYSTCWVVRLVVRI